MAIQMEPGIDEYLRKRLMPVEGAIPHLSRTDMYGNSIPAGSVVGDLFEYINFQQRYNIDARIASALRLSREYLEPLPDGQIPRNSVDEHVQWLGSKSNPSDVREAEYRRAKSSEQLMVADNLHELYTTAGVLLVDAQGHGIISAKIASTIHDTFHAFILTELDRYGKTTPKLFEDINVRLAQSVTWAETRTTSRNRDHALRRNTSRRTLPLCKFRQPSTISVFGGVRALHTDEYRSPRAIPCARFGNSRGSS